MKEIQHDIVTKKAGIDLHMEVSIEGETIIKREADSLVGNFLRLMYGMMGDVQGDTGGKNTIVMGKRSPHYRSESDNEIDNIDWNTSPPVIYLGSYDEIDEVGNGVSNIIYIHANLDAMKGFYYVEEISNGEELQLHQIDSIDRAAGTVTKGNAADWSNITESNWDGELRIEAFRIVEANREDYIFENPKIVLGENFSNKDAEVEDWWLENMIRTFGTTDTTVSEPAVQTTKSEITYSRTFTNNESVDIDVGEIGVICRGPHPDDDDTDILIARDNVTTFTIKSGKSITIDYIMTVSNDGDGGIMAQFHQQLFRQHQRDNRVVRDITNTDENDDETAGQFIVSGCGGNTHPDAQHLGVIGQFLGPVVGTSAKDVSNTNYALTDSSDNDSQIPHGYGDDELVYSGTVIEHITTDKANDEIYFDISRLFENQGSTTITVKETALYAGYNDYRDDDDWIRYATMLARHVLTSTVDVPAGEILKAAYRMKVVV